jgi:hypothetical protein
METVRRRPIGVTLLAVLAGIVAVLAGLHFLQAVGVLPYVVGPVSVRDFNLWYTLMWGLTVWVWAWVVRMLWRVDPWGWLVLLVFAAFNLLFDFVALLGTTTVSDLSLSFLLNVVILIYALLPGTRDAFNLPS